MSNQDQYNSKNDELIKAFEDLIKSAKNLVRLNGQRVGAAAGADTLSQIAVGDLVALQKILGIENVAGRETLGYGPRLLRERAHGLGAGGQGVPPTDVGEDSVSGFYAIGGSSLGLSSWGAAILARRLANQAVAIGASCLSGSRSLQWTRQTAEGWQAVSNLLDTRNTTTDSDGRLRPASPIFRLARDSDTAMTDEEGQQYEPAGAGAANSQAQGVTASRERAGVYRVTGSLGWRADGWQFANIHDGNSLPLLWIDIQGEDGGDLLVRTYHRTHPSAPPFARNEIQGYADGDPIDIPEGRFISLRLAMPEPDAPEHTDEPEQEDT